MHPREIIDVSFAGVIAGFFYFITTLPDLSTISSGAELARFTYLLITENTFR
jgi:hypothetical protein